MVDDPNNGGGQDNRPRRPGGGGGGGFGSIIGMLLPLLMRNPKLLLIVGAIGAGLYFFAGGSNLLKQSGGGFQLGATLDRDKYDKSEIYAQLSATGNQLPSAYSLEKYCPRRLNQGSQGSCVAWSSAYAARTILQARATGQDPNSVAFSPAFLYNQIALEGCQGSYVPYAMDVMEKSGLVPFNDFPYDENDCSRQPGSNHLQAASQFKIRGYQRLTNDDSDYGSTSDGDYAVSVAAVKQNIAQGAPVVIGMMVGGTFMQDMMGTKVWRPTNQDYQMYGFGGHAMCVIGYDDDLDGGAMQIMNSWGPEWGERGIGWVRYKDFEYFVKEAYGLYPMGNAEKKAQSFAVEFGLLDNATQRNIPLTQKSPNLFATRSAIRKGTKFKIEVTNSLECYTYVFGQETDGSSYVLFPYTAKHSPFCGITGTRVFPQNQSLMADDLGNKDFMAIVVTHTAIDYNALNSRINASRKPDYQGKVLDALAGQLVQNITFKQGETISFESPLTEKNAAAMVIELDKL